jgi:hypothetical protein
MLFSQHPHAKGACEEALLTGDLLRAVIAPLLEIPAERENRTACAPAHAQAVFIFTFDCANRRRT